VATVQLRFDGWVTEMEDAEARKQLQKAVGLDNLLYTPDADFSCFADLALTSPSDYYREGRRLPVTAGANAGRPLHQRK
jgi:zeta-carotene desaturase